MKKVILEGYGKCKLPQSVEIIDIKGNIEIENLNELHLKEITLDIFGSEYDLSSLNEPEIIKIKGGNQSKIKLPRKCHQVIIERNIEIVNLDEIEIEKLERMMDKYGQIGIKKQKKKLRKLKN